MPGSRPSLVWTRGAAPHSSTVMCSKDDRNRINIDWIYRGFNMKNNIRLSPGVEKAFYDFLLLTNYLHGGRINTNAWEGLYKFIRYTHSHNVLLSDAQLKQLLILEGAREDDADIMATVYLHCRNLLHKKRPYDGSMMYAWLKSRKQRNREREEYLKSIGIKKKQPDIS